MVLVVAVLPYILSRVAVGFEEDVDVYFANKEVIRHCDQSSQMRGQRSPGTCLFVSSSGQIVHGRDLGQEAGSGKQMLMDMMLRGVVGEMQKRGWQQEQWISVSIVYAASGPARDEAYPVVAFGKRHPRKQPGLLVPNPFFVTPQWWRDHAKESEARSKEIPWESRSRRVLFRGACGPGAHARFRLLRLLDNEGRLDVGFTKVDGAKTMRDCVERLAALNGGTNAEVERILQRGIKPHVLETNFSQYRYLLHMPGSATGSYSRNLQYLWTQGAIVLIWKHSAIEWYYPYLREGVHYVSVDETNLYDELRRIDSDTELQRTLREGARQFALEHLSGNALVDRWQRIFGILRDRQKSSADIPSSCCTCDKDSSECVRACTKCEITRKQGRSIAKFIGLAPKQPQAARVAT